MLEPAPRSRSFRTSLRTLIAATALSGLLVLLGDASAARAACPAQWHSPSRMSVQEARSSLYCLINEQRAANGLGTLTANASLGQAAEHHSRAMKTRNFFGHEPDGPAARRARRRGYMAGASWWMVGESLGWGRGDRGTPGGILAAMMASPTHQAVLLDGRFRDIGVGVAMGTPLPGRARNAAIYTVDLGVRK
jgi:uncharacterized protein YkwD